MKNKKIILNLLLSFVMAFVIGFGFSVKANVNKAHAINGYEVEFVNGTSKYVATINSETTYQDIVNEIKSEYSLSSNDTITFYFYFKNPDTELQMIDKNQFDYNNAKVLDVFNFYGAGPNAYGNYYFRYEVVIASPSTASPSTVTWTQDDMVSNNLVNDYTFSKDGVTLTAEMLNLEYKFIGEGTFSTTLGNFTKIEVTANNGIEGTGWSGDEKGIIWTGEPASSVSFSGGIGGASGVTIVFTIEPAEEQQSQKVITFRPVVVDTRENVTTERVYVNQIPDEVVVKYYVTYNDGVNSFVLVPSYDKDVFTLLDSENNPRVAVNGIDASAITVTGNVKGENDPEFVKIAFDSSTLYDASHEYSAESNENVLLLTLRFSVHTAPTEYGHFRGEFGLVLDNAGKTNNTSSVAYQDLSGEQLGEQEEVFVRLDVDNPDEVAVPENVVDIYKRYTATINTAADSVTCTYRKQPMTVTRVGEFTPNLEYGVEFQYNGNGTPVVTWKDSNNQPLPSAPQNAGTYTVTITVPATDTYSAPEPKTITVTINKALVVVNIKNQSKVYGDDPISFAGNFGVNVPSGLYTVEGTVCQGDTITFNLTSAVTASSDAGSYPISKTNLSVSDGNNGNNYGVDIFDGTYTVSKYIIKVYYGYEQTTFNGGTKTAYSLTGTPNITNNNYEALEEDISGLLGTFNVTYSIALPEGVVSANNPYDEQDCYKVTPLYAFIKEGSANNFEVITYQSDYRINPAAVTLIAGNKSAEFNGGTKADYAAPTEYYVNVGNETASEALRTALGTVTLTVNFPEGVVNAGTYTITPHYTANNNLIVTPSNGTYTINAKDLTDAEKAAIYGAFGIVEVTYDAQGHQMYTFDGSSLPLGLTASDLGTRYSYLAKINDETASDRISAGTYPVTITFTINDPTINQNRNSTYGKEGYQPLSYTFVVKEVVDEVTNKYSSISQKAITITAADKEHVYGNTPQTLTPTTAGIDGEIAVTFTVKNGSDTITLANTTNVGTYTIVPIASNSNYNITLVNGTYKITKANPVLSISAGSTHYNDHLYFYGPTITVGELTLQVNGSNHNNDYGFNYAIEIWKGDQKVLDDAWILENYWLDAGNDYTAKLVLTGNDNYNSASASSDTFEIWKVEVGGPNTITYNGNTVTWSEVTKDVSEKDLHNSTVTYTISGTEYANRSFTATAKGTYYLTITPSNTNYEANGFYFKPVYSVKFLEGTHTANPATPTNMPAEQLLFEDQYATRPETNPSLTGYTFAGWKIRDNYEEEFNFNLENITEDMVDSDGDCKITAQWNIIKYTVTFKYTEDANVTSGEGQNVFTAQVDYNSTVDYQALSLQPTKTSENVGIEYQFANKWLSNEIEYTNQQVDDYAVTADVTFVAQYTTNYISFTITYHVKENGGNYVEQEYKTVVAYNSVIEYRELETDVQWFTAKAWFANEDRTETAPTTMPNHDINVYGAVVFNVGLGDVNGDGYVNANDITLYRQWIVGGYEMTVVAAGTEWETATALEFEPNGKYYLARVADNNADTSKDIRDVSITRMSIVGGYTWEVKTGLNVTGQEIMRNERPTTASALAEKLASGNKINLVADINDPTYNLVVATSKDVYLDLRGYTVTVNKFTVASEDEVTITILNGTIRTSAGITISAPSGDVVLTDLEGYDANGLVNLAAGSNSLHLNGVVEFRNGTIESSTPATVNVEKGTHIVVEKEASVVVEKLVVTEQFVPTVAEDAKISIENNSLVYTPVTVVGNVDVDNDVEIDTFEELVVAAAKDGSYILNADIDLTAQVIVTKNVTLNLNGHKLFNSHDLWAGSSWSLVSVQAGKLTINGEGSLLAKANDCYALDLRDGAELVINGGNYVGNIHAIYVHDGALTVNGGHFSVIQKYNATTPDGYVLNCLDVNYQNGTATIVVKGGSYEGFNPADCPAESPRGHFVPAEYYVVEEENTYTVLPKTYVETEAELVAAVANDNYVVLNADIDLSAQLVVTKNVTLDLNGHNLYNTVDIWNDSENVKTWSLISVQAGKLTINGDGSLLAKANDCFAVDVRNGAELVINGGNYAGNISAVYVLEGALTVNGGYFYVQQSDFNSTVGQEKFVLNCFDANYKNETATIVVNGGSFKLFNPGSNVAEISAPVYTNFLGEGHTVTSQVVEENTVYTVA